MSGTIYFRIVKARERHLDVGASSSFVSAMTNAFGSSPWRVDGSCVEVLRGMAAVFGEDSRRNPYLALINHITREDGETQELEVWPEY